MIAVGKSTRSQMGVRVVCLSVVVEDVEPLLYNRLVDLSRSLLVVGVFRWSLSGASFDKATGETFQIRTFDQKLIRQNSKHPVNHYSNPTAINVITGPHLVYFCCDTLIMRRL